MKRLKTLGVPFLIILIFIAPLLLAEFFYRNKPHYFKTTMNTGQLLSPVIPLQELALQNKDGSMLNIEKLKHNWLIIYLAPQTCSKICLDDLFSIAQVKQAMGNNASRIQQILVTQSNINLGNLSFTNNHNPNLLQLTTSKETLQKFMAKLPSNIKLNQRSSSHNYTVVVDPLGNVILSYATQVPRKGLFNDLQRLLKVSQIG